MRVPNAGFQLLAAGKKGVVMERTDAQLVIPAVIQDSVEIPQPLISAQVANAGPQDNTWDELIQYSVAGVQVATTFQTLGQLAPGVWRVSGSLWHFFTGTSQLLNGIFFGPIISGNVAPWMMIPFLNFAQPLFTTYSFVVHVLNASPIGITKPATIAGDALTGAAMVHASRLF